MSTWRFLWHLWRYRPWLFGFAALLLVVLEVLNIVPPLIMQAFFDTLSPHTQAQLSIWTLIAMWLTVNLVQGVTLIGISWGFAAGENTISALVRSNMFRQIFQLPGARAVLCSPGEALSRLQGDVEAVTVFFVLVYNLCGEVALACVALTIMFSINARIALVVFLPLTGVVIIARMLGKRLERYRAASREAAGHVSTLLGEMFGAVLAIKVADAESRVMNHFKVLNAARRHASLIERFFDEMLNSVYHNMSDIGTGLILLLVASSMRGGSFTIGNFVFFTFCLSYVTVLSGVVGKILARYRQTGISVKRLSELLQGAPPETLIKHAPIYLRGPLPVLPALPARRSDRLSLLQASRLTYHYPDSGRGITDICLRLKRGTFTVITGRVGAGKTTLLRVLLGLLPGDAGEIRWNERVIDDPASWFVPPHCAYTPQAPRLFSETLRNNILLGIAEETTNLPAAIYAAVLEHDLSQFEQALDMRIGPRGVKLSGGQVQRVATARMFVRESELLVFDDLSSALDVETEQTLWRRLFEHRDITCLVVTHRRAALRHADHILVLKDGHLEAEGKLDDLLETCEEMQRLWKGDVPMHK